MKVYKREGQKITAHGMLILSKINGYFVFFFEDMHSILCLFYQQNFINNNVILGDNSHPVQNDGIKKL